MTESSHPSGCLRGGVFIAVILGGLFLGASRWLNRIQSLNWSAFSLWLTIAAYVLLVVAIIVFSRRMAGCWCVACKQTDRKYDTLWNVFFGWDNPPSRVAENHYYEADHYRCRACLEANSLYEFPLFPRWLSGFIFCFFIGYLYLSFFFDWHIPGGDLAVLLASALICLAAIPVRKQFAHCAWRRQNPDPAAVAKRREDYLDIKQRREENSRCLSQDPTYKTYHQEMEEMEAFAKTHMAHTAYCHHCQRHVHPRSRTEMLKFADEPNMEPVPVHVNYCPRCDRDMTG